MMRLDWPELDERECNKDWENAIEYSYSEWEKDQSNKTKLIRTLFLYWYVYVEDISPFLSDDLVLSRLKTVSSFGKEYLSDNIDFQWLYGYVSSINPELFGKLEDYDEIEQEGRLFIKRALEKEPKNIFLQMLEKGTEPYDKYSKWKYDRRNDLERYFKNFFQGCSLYDEYFAEIGNKSL
ncbi:hypothetical protein [Listeria booriae]|uniref:Uncharacterized protein n=1 Tax=Listeria booriae TaxID=1552123 RepID=A0A7X1A5E7_9LIST|nr:hypothetical protein [Listeria booriae]MBC1891528.1 hypothetical protein [Listeria booriae]MBC1983325.1 hypothetical protein [Listeria booriae]MBC2067591.1 hypothetical protein [Listeria booriae]MBC2371594.1 hypothetical protein [Listeria booriae]